MFEIMSPEEIALAGRPPEVAPEDLVDELASVLAQRARLEARAAELLAQIEDTYAYEWDGYSSPIALLKHRMSMHPGEAARMVFRSRQLDSAPLVAFAFARGAITGAQVDVLLEAQGAAAEAFAAAEAELVEMALDVPLTTELKRRLDYWIEKVNPDGLPACREVVRHLRSLNLRRDGEMMRITGWVDIEAGERLRAVLDPGPPAVEDHRTAAARRADLLMDIVGGAGSKTDLIVHVSWETLVERLPGISETGSGTVLLVDEIRRLACDGNVTRVVFGPDSQPLDVGRTKRLVAPSMRMAVVARDRHCVFPGCDRPAGWCDVHHLRHWADGGPTALENMVLLCRHHHGLVHEAGWKVTGIPGSLTFWRCDGSKLGSSSLRRSRPCPFFDVNLDPPELPRTSLREIYPTLPRLRSP
jgi:hypothetical protein